MQATLEDRRAQNGAPSPQTQQPTAVGHPHGRDTRRRDRSIVQNFKAALSPARPDPWLNRKFAVGILFAISAWSFYVVVGRICVPVFQGSSSSNFSVATAGGLLAGFLILFLIYAWSYLRMLATGPGLARDHIPETGAPAESYAPLPPGASMSGGTGAGTLQSPGPVHGNHDEMERNAVPALDEAPDPSEFAPAINLLRPTQHPPSPPDQHSSSATLTSHLPPPPFVAAGATREVPDWRTVERPLPDVHYGPRWCRFCRINKPDRTHHCRHCGTCIMQFDHHCIWVGGCVGWANHKFFMTFVFWAMLYCFYILSILIVYLVQADVDGQVIGLIAVAALFGLFTLMMCIQHVYLIVTAKSTVEAYSGRDQQERETQHLNILYGFWSHHKEKRQVRQKWKDEFGGTSADERWRSGSKMEMWKREMGERWYEWILPIGRPLGDGLHFSSNPGFGPNGEWLKKQYWPKGVE